MSKSKIIRLILCILFIVFSFLAVSQYFKAQSSDELYEQSRKTYYDDKSITSKKVTNETTDTEITTTKKIKEETTRQPKEETTRKKETTETENDLPKKTLKESIKPEKASPVTTKDDVNEDIDSKTTEPNTTKNTPEDNANMKDISSIKDVIGWINIPGTKIDYPVTQTTDNVFYLKHNYLGKKDHKGSIFMDFRNNSIEEDRNHIIYGHKMADGTMFSDLAFYVQGSTYRNYFKNNNIIKFNNFSVETKWKIFSVYVVNLDEEDYHLFTKYRSNESFKMFIKQAKTRSLLKSDIEVNLDDQILTLVTCNYWFDNARVIIHAVRQ